MSDKVNILDLWKITKTANTPLFGSSSDLSSFDFMADYLTDFAKFDRNFVAEKASFSPVWNLNFEDDVDGVLETFQDDILAFITKHNENLKRLWTLMSVEYEPLQNYDSTETSTDTYSGSDVVTDDIGEAVTTDTMGQHITTNSMGEKITTTAKGEQIDTDAVGGDTLTDAYGATSTTENRGAQSNTSTDGVSAFNSGSFQDSTETVDSIGAQTNTTSEIAKTDTHSNTGHTDTHTDGARTDTLTDGAHSDTLTSSEHTDTHTENAKQNRNTTAYGKKIVHTLRRFGNIGVTTSQQMAQSEVDFWTTFNFYSILFDMITRELLTLDDVGISLF